MSVLLQPIAPDVVSDLFRKAQDYLHGKESTPSFDVQAGWALRGLSESLRTASGEEEFERAIELSSQPALFGMLLRLRLSPNWSEIERQSRIAALHPPQVFDKDAHEYLKDLAQATALLLQLVAPGGQPDMSVSDVRKAIRATRKEPGLFIDLTRYAVALLGLSAAAYVDEPWHHWKRGRLWRVGRDSLVGMGQRCGHSADDVLNQVFTDYDKKLAQLPFDQTASDRAKLLLGFQQHGIRDRAAG